MTAERLHEFRLKMAEINKKLSDYLTDVHDRERMKSKQEIGIPPPDPRRIKDLEELKWWIVDEMQYIRDKQVTKNDNDSLMYLTGYMRALIIIKGMLS